MKTKPNKQDVLDWIHSGSDYDTGVMLYSKIGRNEVLKKIFPGRESIYKGKLLYELCKTVGIDNILIPNSIEKTIFLDSTTEQKFQKLNESLVETKLSVKTEMKSLTQRIQRFFLIIYFTKPYKKWITRTKRK